MGSYTVCSFFFFAFYFQSKILGIYLFDLVCYLYNYGFIFIKTKVKIDLEWATSDSRVTGFCQILYLMFLM